MSENATQLLQQATDLHGRGSFADAIPLYDRVLALEPGNDEARYYRAIAEFELGRTDAAIHAVQDIARRNPGAVPVHVELGRMLQRAGKLQDARAAFETAAGLAPNEPQIQVLLGNVLLLSDDHAGAAAKYEAALGSQPNLIDARAALAKAYLELGRWADAVAACDGVLARVPGHTGVLALKSVALFEAGETSGAREIMDFDRFLSTHRIGAPPGYASEADFNAALADAVMNHPSIAYEPADYSTKKGYHTGELANDTAGPIPVLLDWIRGLVREKIAAVPADGHPFHARPPKNWKLNAWAVAMEDTGHQAPHIHRDAWLSGCYYVRVPADVAASNDDKAGWIEFGRPHDYTLRKTVSDVHAVLPEEGMAVLFPAFFYHRTIPLRSKRRRISLAFDVIPV